jgi:serine O-acetyltransferase
MRAECVCEGGGLRAAFRDDLDRYVFGLQRDGVTGSLAPLLMGLLSQGMWATTAYRLNHYARHRLRSRLLAALPHIFHCVIMRLTRIQIDPKAHIGPGLKFPHGGHIVIGPVQVGRNCDIYQGVTLGHSISTLVDRPSGPDVPALGNRVWVGPGAVIAGGVIVDNDAVVGANSLLVRDVPPRGVMIGVPARLISSDGSFTQIRYRDMYNDDEREVALTTGPETSPRYRRRPDAAAVKPSPTLLTGGGPAGYITP